MVHDIYIKSFRASHLPAVAGGNHANYSLENSGSSAAAAGRRIYLLLLAVYCRLSIITCCNSKDNYVRTH